MTFSARFAMLKRPPVKGGLFVSITTNRKGAKVAWIKEQRRKTGPPAYCVVYNRGGKRCYLSLGQSYAKRDAEEIAANVDRLLTAETTGQPIDKKTAGWLDSISDDLKRRIVAADLLIVKPELTTGEIWQAYFDAETYDIKPTTKQNKKSSRRRFFDFFPADLPLSQIGPNDGAAFTADLRARNLATATIAGTVRDVKRVFNWGVEKGLIEKSPFSGLKKGDFKNKERETYISLETFLLMLDAAPSALWRAVLCLYRLEGLRCSEPLYLRWQDVDFTGGRLLVTSPKTERYRPTRYTPLFPTVKKELLELWKEQGKPGPTAYVVSSNRTTIYKHVSQIVFKAGVEPYPRLIQNLRSGRAIEIYREFGAIAEREWLGHSEKTAAEHYLHVLQDDFARAANFDEIGGRAETYPETSPQTRSNTL